MKTVEGSAAVEYTCEACGRQCFASMVAVEVTDEDREQQPELGEGSWTMAPTTVKCNHCGERFNLKYGDDELERPDD